MDQVTAPLRHREKVALEFRETMRGYLAAGQLTPEAGYEEGRRNDNELILELNVWIDDVHTFCEDRTYEAECRGTIDSLYGATRIVRGSFNLFVPSPGDRNKKYFTYRLFFYDPQGNPLTLSGRKDVQSQVGIDIWTDTTTLDCYIFGGHIGEQEEFGARIEAAGTLHINFADLLRQLRSIRAHASTPQRRIDGVLTFARFFAGGLAQQYIQPYFIPTRHDWERHIPLYTTAGVENSEITYHPYTSGDNLGLGLLRFQRRTDGATRREGDRNVVVLIPGLTTSSDMFIMPEHRNIVTHLLDAGYSDVWTLDSRTSNRFSYNLQRHRYTLDDVALYDYAPALEEIRRHAGADARVHVIAHCIGALTFLMAMVSGVVTGIASLIVNSLGLTPHVPRWSSFKLGAGPFFFEYLLHQPYLNPRWSKDPSFTVSKAVARATSFFHRECDVPECHMLSMIWGTGWPAAYNHANMDEVTHWRAGDLFGGTGVHYYRHIRMMVRQNCTAVKYDRGNAAHKSLPDNYLENVHRLQGTPMLLTTGSENRIFYDSNIRFFRVLQDKLPGLHGLRVFPRYGHQDVFMGKNAARDTFGTMVEFLKTHA